MRTISPYKIQTSSNFCIRSSSLPVPTSSCKKETYYIGSAVSGSRALGTLAYEAEFPPPPMDEIRLQEEVFQSRLIERDRSGRVRREVVTEIHSRHLEIERLCSAMVAAVRSGNLQTALFLFATLEAKQVNELSKTVINNMQTLQQKRRDASAKIGSLPANGDGSKQLAGLQQELGEIDGDIAIYQQILKDIIQQKQEALELANSVSQSEHQTAMSIARR